MKDVAREVPLDKLVLETDAPYLTPVPFRGKENKPAYIKYVAEEIARLKNVTFEEGCQLSSIGDNAFSNCYNITDIYYTGTEEEWNKIKKSDAYGVPLVFCIIGLALLFGTFHGYKVPHKIFFGLAILFTCIFGVIYVFAEGGTDSIQIYGFILRFIRAIGFYVFYGLLEKFSSEYEGVEE